MKPKATEIECIIPVLQVANLQKSIDFYTQKLGFQLDWRSDPVCSVSRDNSPVMLSQSTTTPSGSWVWIGLESDSVFQEFREQGVTVLQEPRNYSWAYEMKFADLDGNVLWVGTESRSDLPVLDRE